MKILKVIYDNNTSFILDILVQISIKIYIETYNISHYKSYKKAIPILTRFGTKNVPLIVFEDENLQEYGAIWSESNPDWKLEIFKILSNE